MSGQAVPILMYHSVATAPNDATRALSVAPEAFTEQMAQLADLGRTPVTTAELARCWRRGDRCPSGPSSSPSTTDTKACTATPCPCSPSTASSPPCSSRPAGCGAPTTPGAASTPCSTGTRCATSPAAGSRSAGTATPIRSWTNWTTTPCGSNSCAARRSSPTNWAPPRSLRLPVRLLQSPGAPYRARDGVPPVARRRQRSRPPRSGAVRAATCHRAPQHGRGGVRAARPGPCDRSQFRQGPRPHQGIRRGPKSTTGSPEGHRFPCLTRPPQPRPNRPRPRRPSSPGAAFACPGATGAAAASCSATPMR